MHYDAFVCKAASAGIWREALATFSISAAKARLSEPIRRVEAGEEIVIARNNRPVVRLVPHVSKAVRSKGFGSMKGRVEVRPEFFEPLPPEELKAWYRS